MAPKKRKGKKTRTRVGDTRPASQAGQSNLITWAEFLMSAPPGTSKQGVLDVVEGSPEAADQGALSEPNLHIYCNGVHCRVPRIFYCTTDSRFWFKWSGEEKHAVLTYRCKYCEVGYKVYAVWVSNVLPDRTGTVAKIGEWPPFGPQLPSRVISLIGPDRDLFLTGSRAENQGMGIGAFAYYRRVVEQQNNHIISEIIKVAKRLEAKKELIGELEAAKSDFRFDRAIDKIRMGIPEVLKIRGHNPLTLLHRALSAGLHANSDAACLEMATTIRVVLTELAERISQVLKEQAELDEAVSRLLKGKAEP